MLLVISILVPVIVVIYPSLDLILLVDYHSYVVKSKFHDKQPHALLCDANV